MRYSSALAGAVLCVAVLAACGRAGAFAGEGPNGCVRSPTTLSPGIAPKSGATLTVKLGAFVYVELVEAEKYLSWPAGTKPPPPVFPWAAARSSDPSVLRRVPLCPSSAASTLPVVLYAFRALTPGTATLTAPIAQAWKRVNPVRRRGLHPYRATVIVAPSSANAAWSTPQTIFSVAGASNLQSPRVARDAAGDAVAVWARYPEKGDWGAVEAATRRAGGSWSAPIRLGFGSAGASDPEVAMSSGGEATVVWEQSTFDGKRGKRQRSARLAVETRSHRAEGGWGDLAVLASRQEGFGAGEEPSQRAPGPQVAVSARRDVTVAFSIRERHAKPVNGKEDILVFMRRGGRWRSPAVVAHTVENPEVQLALDGRGETILAWEHEGPPGERASWVQALTLARDGRPEGPAQALSAKSKTSYAMNLAANSRGAAVLTWSQELGEGEGYGPLEVATRPAGGRFTTKPVTLAHKSLPAVAAINLEDTATVLFERTTPKGPEEEELGPLEVATHPADGGWSKPEMLSPQANPQALACGPHGELVALWEASFGLSSQPPGRHPVIDASIQPPGAAWPAPVTISPENTSEDAAGLALAASGRATAIWLREPTPGTHLIETADYKPA
ncbi:MAG TPA: hypothetical protein VK756_04335 [Solirubrobacteraceae bacterium]|jgi:hypothetical protein|nr:hypothetical protein [Solirubrobacteraceae bacterium]